MVIHLPFALWRLKHVPDPLLPGLLISCSLKTSFSLSLPPDSAVLSGFVQMLLPPGSLFGLLPASFPSLRYTYPLVLLLLFSAGLSATYPFLSKGPFLCGLPLCSVQCGWILYKIQWKRKSSLKMHPPFFKLKLPDKKNVTFARKVLKAYSQLLNISCSRPATTRLRTVLVHKPCSEKHGVTLSW